MPPAAAHRRAARCSQVLRNFVSNAIKFTERGEIRVSAAAEPDEHASASRSATRASASRRRTRSACSRTSRRSTARIQRRVRGTGLGLPLTRKLAALLGGRVELASAPGAGSTFTLVIPYVLPDDTGAADAEPPTRAAADAADGGR